MTRVIYNGSIKGFSGKIGNLIFRQLPNGNMVVTQAPPKKTGRQKRHDKLKRSPAQQAHNKRFAKASAYAKQAAKVHPIYAERVATMPMTTAYNLALKDWFHPPEIQRVERRKGRILVKATDNVMVARVQVSVLDEKGRVLETGEASRGERDWWRFSPQAQGTSVVAEAWDLPGHKTKFVA
jgi:hypothetical protein